MEKLQASRKSPEVQRVEEVGARKAMAEWRCGMSRPRAPLSPHLAHLASAAARTLGGEPCDGCPFEGAYHPESEWMREVFDALVLARASGVGMPWRDALARDPSAADRDAILVMERADAKLRRLEMVKDGE